MKGPPQSFDGENREVKPRKPRGKTAEAESYASTHDLFPNKRCKGCFKGNISVLPRGFRGFTSQFSRSKDCGGPLQLL